MRYIEKIGLPDDLKHALKQALDNNLSWNELGRQQLPDESGVKENLREWLSLEQSGLCAYSEVSLTEYGFHIEHIKPKAHYPTLRFDYTNLVASSPENQANVDRRDLFGGHKKDQYAFNEALFISPLHTDCETFFQYAPNGDIQAKDNLTADNEDRANNTIDCLGLQCRLLKNKRSRLYKALHQQIDYMLDQPEAMQAFKNDYLTANQQGHLKPFQSMVKQIFNVG